VIVGQKELISLVCFLKDKIKNNMVIPVFKGSKGEDPEIFLREYKRTCIDIRLKIATKWLNLFIEFL
jgi:hypothetical protein